MKVSALHALYMRAWSRQGSEQLKERTTESRGVDDQERRIRRVIGDKPLRVKKSIERWHHHLVSHLVLPCEVTGIEDFQWEEFYVIGPGSAWRYRWLRRNRPSYQDIFDLTEVRIDADSEWSMFSEDLKACVRRKDDGKEFVLGLSELETTDKDSMNSQLLDDYSVWFVNSR